MFVEKEGEAMSGPDKCSIPRQGLQEYAQLFAPFFAATLVDTGRLFSPTLRPCAYLFTDQVRLT